jgi:hypothetical protein
LIGPIVAVLVVLEVACVDFAVADCGALFIDALSAAGAHRFVCYVNECVPHLITTEQNTPIAEAPNRNPIQYASNALIFLLCGGVSSKRSTSHGAQFGGV